MKRIQVCMKNRKFNGDVLITPDRNLEHNRKLAIGKSIVRINNSMGYTFVTNLTSRPIRLIRRSKIGSFEEFNDDMVKVNLRRVELEQQVLRQFKIENIDGKDHMKSLNMDDDECNRWMNSLKFGEKLKNSQCNSLKTLIKKYGDIFVHNTGDLGRTTNVKHRIDTGDALPIKQRAYRVSFFEREKIRKQVDEMLENDIVEHSNSPWSSPVVLVKKKDGNLRFCVDYRKLNSVTKKDNYPLPRIDDALDRLQGAQFFTSMDCDQAYYQVQNESADREKTAFITPDGLYEFKVMPFGLCNAPATFQRLIDSVLEKLKWSIALVYLDDIVVFSRDFETHLKDIESIFIALRRAGLKLKPAKCVFGKDKLLYLGHIISADGVEVNPDKIRAVTDFPVPKTPKKVMSFVSLCSYYRRFIPNFSKIGKPLFALTSRHNKFVWTEECQLAFQKLKDLLVSSECLAYPQDDAPTEIHVDASMEGFGATLVQTQNGQERVVAFRSRSLKKHEKNYSVSELECAAVIWAVRDFRAYVYGKKFKIVTDHCALCHLLKLKDPEGKLARWALRLQPFDFEIVYKSGVKHKDADALSRNPVDPPPPTEDDPLDFEDKLCIMQSKKLINLCALNEYNMHDLQSKDTSIAKIINCIEKNDQSAKCRIKHLEDYLLENGLLFKLNPEENGRMWRLVVPRCLVKSIMKDIHDDSAGHLGFLKSWHLLKNRFYWSGMHRDLRRYIMCCEKCQFFNRRTRPQPGPLQPVEPPSRPFVRIGVDFQGPYPRTQRSNTAVLEIVDHATRYVESWPCRAIDTKCAIRIIEECIIFKHSCPAEILVDRGSCFTSEEFRTFCKKYHIRLLYTSAYSPQTNGICEKSNDNVKRIIAKHVDSNHKNWDKLVSRAAFSCNITRHSVTGVSPFYLVFGREPYLPCDRKLPIVENLVDDDESRVADKRVTRANAEAHKKTVAFQKKCKQEFDKKHPQKTFEPGDEILLANFAKQPGKVAKWLTKWIGPFIVLKQTSPINYK